MVIHLNASEDDSDSEGTKYYVTKFAGPPIPGADVPGLGYL